MLGGSDDLSSLQPYGLAETCRVVGGSIPLWHYHRARLQRGGVPPDLLERIEALALSEAATWSDSRSRRIRLGITVEPDGELALVSGIHLSSLDVLHGPVAARVDVAEIAVADSLDPPTSTRRRQARRPFVVGHGAADRETSRGRPGHHPRPPRRHH